MDEGRKAGEIQVKCLLEHLMLREQVNSRNASDFGESDKGRSPGAAKAGCAGDRHVQLIATPVICDMHRK